jgi:hypothetical protein
MAEFRSGMTGFDEAYAKASRDIAGNLANGRFVAGKRWSTIWTRDSAYAIDLGVALSHPAQSQATLRERVSNGAWTQDPCRHFGGWPNLTDSIVGTIGAWATYLASGDTDFLRWSYDVTLASLARAESDARDSESGLFRGCSSFMESNSGYPFRFNHRGRLVGRTKALSTNLLYYRAYDIAARMAALLGHDGEPFAAKASELRATINTRFWVPEKGLYSYIEYENGRLSSRMEGLGESLAMLWDVAGPERAREVLRHTPITEHGLPCLWPRYLPWRVTWNDAHYYHNGMVWPFVQGYWAWAAARQGDVTAFARELSALAALAGRAPTFHEFYRPLTGRPDGSPRQLWSAAGYQAMIHHGLFGMTATESGLDLSPLLPEQFSQIALHGFRYRESTLDITITRSTSPTSAPPLTPSPLPASPLPASPLASPLTCLLDGHPCPPTIPATLTGAHTLTITL